ncbi:hypothetical protein [Thermomonas sp.]|jgi:hypothetical protein|uniref:hypothetical protein n=1 Tax=Thermomonas sp. TaxID=1971895 RepID=UPI00257A8E7D|nr:hypothetical protein [Thermomonas sp.]
MSEPLEETRHLSRRTTPTWEVELLISGVAVFAMLQLPGWLDDRMFALEPRLDEDWRIVLALSYFYAKSAAVVLAATFAMHLMLRAQWIALVGVHSVYPQGIRLDRLRMGPIQRSIEAERQGTTEAAIERADNRSSVAFAIGVSVALIIASVCVALAAVLVLATLATQALGLQTEPVWLFSGALAALLVPYVIAASLDQYLPGRIRPDTRSHRIITSVLRFYTRMGMSRTNNRIVSILGSNGGERRMMATVVGLMLASIISVSATYLAMRSDSVIGSYSGFPDADALAVNPAHYDDQRDPARDNVRPYLQSAVIIGPYLKLVVPYQPRRDEAAMRDRCGKETRKLAGTELAMAQLACLQGLHPATLDGKPLTDLRYEIASDPRTDRPALLAMIDVRELPRGRHELRVARPPRADRKPDKDNPDPHFDAIPFWR